MPEGDGGNNLWATIIAALASIIGAGGIVRLAQVIFTRTTTDKQYKELLRQERRSNTRYRAALEKAENELQKAKDKYETLLVRYLHLKHNEPEEGDGDEKHHTDN